MLCLFVESALDRDNFMDPIEAKKFGLIDHIVEHSAEERD